MCSSSRLTDPKPDLSRAVKARLPATPEPQLATLAAAPKGTGWVVETKLDGYRLLARVEDGVARLPTRRGHDWIDKMREGHGYHDHDLAVEPPVPDAQVLDGQNSIGLDLVHRKTSQWLSATIIVRSQDGSSF